MSGVTEAGDAPPVTSSPGEAFAALTATFEDATAAAGLVEHELLLAGRRLRLRFAGPALVPAVLPAFTHLVADPTDDSGPDLTVNIWDSTSTGTPPVPVQESPAGTEDGPRYHAERDGYVMDAADLTLTVRDTRGGEALYYVPGLDTLQWYHRAAPLKELLHTWSSERRLHLVHAGAVGGHGGGVLVTGVAGAGKSTTSLACAAAGLGYAGDDYVLVDPDGPVVHSAYCSARLNWHTVERFPGLLEPTNAVPDEKALGFIGTDQPGGAMTGFPLTAVLVPKVTGERRTRLIEIRPAQALLALAPSTLLQLPGGQPSALRAGRRILEAVPSYALEVGTDLDEVTAAVRGLIEGEGP